VCVGTVTVGPHLASAVLVRRAAEDGFSATVSVLPRGLQQPHWRTRVELVGPLTPDLAYPEPGWCAEAAELYRTLRETNNFAHVYRKPAPLAPNAYHRVIVQELELVAARDGLRVMTMEWEYGYDVCLREAERQPTAEAEGV
jgi:hypothetical protein